MDNVDTREWLLTNGLGSFASGTICDARTRTYHGWLTAALNPPGRRILLLSHVDASLEIAGQIFSLGTNFWTDDEVGPTGYQLLQSFTVEPIPTWIWGQADWQISRQIVMPFGLGSEKESGPHTPPRHRVLVQYRYQGSDLAIVRLRPLIADRDFHHLQSHDSGKTFSQILGDRQVMLQALQNGKAGTLWTLGWSQGHYQPEGAWYWHYYYPEEAQRGLDYQEDLFSPGYLTVMLQPGDALTIEASVGLPTGSVQNASFDRA
ncbi:glycogen debranching enzyme N-terminal domain-containing protein, partial [Leptolyngbya sp. FACHB-36]|uniref:glycogen debranching enzyme N-terminal domain-containing protein n=1 Tax=Leptolyngbya sp. FACHB-36 TaxID=2692808 RepID=UPI00167FE589